MTIVEAATTCPVMADVSSIVISHTHTDIATYILATGMCDAAPLHQLFIGGNHYLVMSYE